MTIKEREQCRELVEEVKKKKRLRWETSFTELESILQTNGHRKNRNRVQMTAMRMV